ncbi:hypothetical protein JOD97_003706 [Duganella sp. 1411]|uniref:hypothetical protein n=1 Tax=Duganella sp. 1411 TaxID=2806572 RepID=UPI001AEA9822|nr:hypothetical protein [Duganella sp. 1411]MBP1205644.1 hypothetical protein [Duganella sp. 1411]
MNRILLRTLAVLVATCLISCGGGGGGESSAPAATTAPVGNKNMLFVTDINNQVLAAVNTLNPAANSNLAAKVFNMPQRAGEGLAYDGQKDWLYMSAGIPSQAGNSIVVFDHASALDGNIKPSRTIVPAMESYISLLGLALDKERDILYANTSRGDLFVFNNASKLNGTVTPDRVLNVRALTFAIDFKRSILYVARGQAFIYAYSNLDTLTVQTTSADPREIIVNPIGMVDTMAIDSVRDRLYFGVKDRGIAVVENASAAGSAAGTATVATSTRTPAMTLAVSAPAYFQVSVRLAFDPANDRLYVGAGKKATLVNNASTLTATTVPTSVVGLSAPDSAFIGAFAFPQ